MSDAQRGRRDGARRCPATVATRSRRRRDRDVRVATLTRADATVACCVAAGDPTNHERT